MILGVFGNVGKYKTAITTLLALLHLQQHIDVYTNYDIAYLDYNRFLHKLSISELLELEITRGLILIDEVYTIAESRVSTAKINRFFSYFIFQSRKRKVDIIYTAQLTSSVDLRLFNLTDKKLACFGEQNGKIKFKLVYDNNGKTKTKTFSVPKFVFEEYVFNHYDSWQPVDALGIQDLIIEVEKYDYEQLNKRIDRAVEELLQKNPEVNIKNLTKYNVDNMLLRASLPLSLSSYVYSRLKTEHRQLIQKNRAVPSRMEYMRRLTERRN